MRLSDGRVPSDCRWSAHAPPRAPPEEPGDSDQGDPDDVVHEVNVAQSHELVVQREWVSMEEEEVDARDYQDDQQRELHSPQGQPSSNAQKSYPGPSTFPQLRPSSRRFPCIELSALRRLAGPTRFRAQPTRSSRKGPSTP